MKNLERDRRRKKGAIGSQDGSFRTFKRRPGQADGRAPHVYLRRVGNGLMYCM